MNCHVKRGRGGLHFPQDAFCDTHPWRKGRLDLSNRWGFLQSPCEEEKKKESPFFTLSNLFPPQCYSLDIKNRQPMH